jgi:hypothetical protein
MNIHDKITDCLNRTSSWPNANDWYEVVDALHLLGLNIPKFVYDNIIAPHLSRQGRELMIARLELIAQELPGSGRGRGGGGGYFLIF